MNDYNYFEDFVPGQVFESSPVTITQPEIIAFAEQFDPQPMHTDPLAAAGITGGLIASGWHTGSITMRLLITGGFYKPAPGSLGLGFDSLRWRIPVRPGDSLRLRLTVLSLRESETRPGFGIVTNKFETLNQHDEVVQDMVSSALIPKRGFRSP